METQQNDKEVKENQDSKEKNADWLSRLMAAGGYILLGVTAILIMFIAMKYYDDKREFIELMPNQGAISFLLQHYALEVFVLIGAIITGNLGIRLLFGANPSSTEVIPTKDRALLEPLIKNADKEAINQYVILSSLSGFTGTFQKIGFSGLPLATVSLTLVFSLLSFFNDDFMELAKLTLGAFIGSFVQKGQDQIKQAQEANKS